MRKRAGVAFQQNSGVLTFEGVEDVGAILPEQAIGRGLRLMFRGKTYSERVDIIGNKAFLSFVDDLEKLEDIQLETFEVGKDQLKIISISPQMPERAAYDLSLPRLTPVLVRKKSLHSEIEVLDYGGPNCQDSLRAKIR